MPETTDRGSNQLGDQPIGDLVKQLSEQTATLVRQEMRLAQAELQEKGKKAGIGAGMFGASGLVAFFGAACLIAAAVLALATAVDHSWLAAVIVGVVLLAVAGVAALMGKKQIDEATPPAPERAMSSMKRDVDTVKRRARR
jgi:membrane protein